MKKYDLEIIDCHIHPYVEDTSNTALFTPPLSSDDFIAELTRVGITKACGSVIGPRQEGFDYIKKFNRDAVSLAAKHPD